MARKPKQTQEQKDIGQFQDETKVGQGMANDLLGPIGFLGRVDQNLPSYGADPNILNSGELLARLRSESYGGGQTSPQQQDALGHLGYLADTAGIRDQDTQNVINRRYNALDQDPISADMHGMQDTLKGEYDHSRDLDPLVQEAIDRQRSGLGGLTAPENTALLESSMADANRGFQGALDAAAGAGGAAGRTNNAGAVRDLVDNYGRSGLDAANNLAVQNVNIKGQRLNDFTNLAQFVDNSKFQRSQDTLGRYSDFTSYLDKTGYDRRNAALGLFEDSTGKARNDEYSRAANAAGAYSSAVQTNDQANNTDKLARLRNYQDEMFRTKQDNMSRVLSNINTLSSEISARTGVTLGVPQYLESVRSSRAANSLAQQQIAAAMKPMSIGGGSGGGGGSSGGNDTFDTPGLGAKSSQQSVALGGSI